MKKNEIKEKFLELADEQIVKTGCEKQFFTKVYGENDTLFTWLITAFGPVVGFSLAGVLSVLGVNIATVSVGGILGFFGVTTLSPWLLTPFVVAAIGVSVGGIVVSRKTNKIKNTSSSPQNRLFLIIISKIYIPVMWFLKFNYFNRPLEYFINKIKTELNNAGVSKCFLEKYFTLIEDCSYEELEILSEVFIEFVVELKNKLPGQGKLYGKDFKKDTLLKKSVELCNYYNEQFCDSIENRKINENKINEFFVLLENKNKNVEKNFLQIKKERKNTRKIEKNS